MRAALAKRTFRLGQIGALLFHHRAPRLLQLALAAVSAAATEGSSLSVDVLPRQFSSALCVQLHGIASRTSDTEEWGIDSRIAERNVLQCPVRTDRQPT